MSFITALPGGRGLSSGHVEALVRECPFGRFFRDADGDVLLIQDLVVAGTTVRWFLLTLRVWKQTRERALTTLRLMLAAPAPAGPGADAAADGTDDPDDLDAGLDDDEGNGGEGEARRPRPARTVVH
jgi:hypothetical protein